MSDEEKKPKDPLAELTKQVGKLADALKSQGEILKGGLSVRLSNGKTFQVYGYPDDLKALRSELIGRSRLGTMR